MPSGASPVTVGHGSSIAIVPDAETIDALVAAAVAGEQAAWNRLVDRFAGLVWSVTRSFGLFGVEAADVSQTVWLRCVEHLDRIREPAYLGAWLATTTRNECLRYVRRRGRSVPVAEVAEMMPPAEAPDLAERLIVADDHRALYDALDRLPRHCQALLRLLLADPPLTYDEIAATLEIPKGSIGPTRGRCLNHLRVAVRL
jgi:RNA polymerase sigma factor (sigma-70 family)